MSSEFDSKLSKTTQDEDLIIFFERTLMKECS